MEKENPFISNSENIKKLAGAKSNATGLGLNLALGLENDVDNTPKTNELINELQSVLDEFEKNKREAQNKIDELTNSIFKRRE